MQNCVHIVRDHPEPMDLLTKNLLWCEKVCCLYAKSVVQIVLFQPRGQGEGMRAQRCRLTATISQARDDVDTVSVTHAIGEDAIPPNTAATTTHVLRRGRQPREPNFGRAAPRTRKTRRPSVRRGQGAH